MHSTKFNYAMNFLVKVSGALFSFISYPYAFRMLGAERMGSVSFAMSFSALFAMVAVLGIPIYGIRECAKVRDNPQALSKTTAELLTIQVCATAFSLLAFALSVRLIPKLQGEGWLCLIQALVIAASAINVEWVFSAMEQFGYIALRTTVVKAVMTLLVFVLVGRGEDYLRYALLLACATVVSNLINLCRLFRVSWIAPLGPPIEMKRHLQPIFIFFVQTVAITIYTSMDSVMLYFLQGEYAVGIYDAGIKIKLILSYLVTGMSAVLLPKLSYFVAKSQKKAFWQEISKTLEFTVVISLPIMMFFGLMASETMEIVSGLQDEHGAILLRVLLPTVFLIGCSSIAASQILTPTHREKPAMYAYLVGAGVNLLLNAVLIPRWSVVGAAIATLVAEVVVLAVELRYLKSETLSMCKDIHWRAPLLASILPIPLLWLAKTQIAWLPARFLVSAITYGLLWLIMLVLWKEPLLMAFLKARKGTTKTMKEITKNNLIFYLGIALLSLIFMILFGNVQGFWYDEFAQICYSAPPKTLLDSLLIADPTPPLFTVVANLWMRVVPFGERWLLLLPQLAVAGAAVVMGLWCEKFYGLRGGILGTTLLAFSQMIVEQCGFEFRGYGFYLLFATLTLYLHSCLGEKKSFITFTLSLIGLAYCHLLGVGICLALGLWDFLLICRKRSPWKSFIPYLIAAAIFFPWGLYFLTESGSSAVTASLDWMTKPSIWGIVKLIAFLCGNHVVVCLLFAIGGMLAVCVVKKQWKTPDTMEQVMPLFVGAVLIVGVFTYGLLRADYASLWVKRYFTGLFPCAAFLAVWGAVWLMERCKGKENRVLAVLLLIIVPVWALRITGGDAPLGVHYHREAAKMLQEEPNIEDTDTLVLSSLGAFTDGWNWLYLENGGKALSVQSESTDEIDIEELKAYKTIYVDDGYNTVKKELQEYLDANYQLVHEWEDLSLQKYVRK